MYARWSLIALLLASAGCSTTRIRANPDDQDKGFRFYRPKPYLFIQPALEECCDRDSKLTFLNIERVMMPDFSEQYSIRVRPGLGDNTTSFKLDNGWNLTEMAFGLDSKTDENITEAAGLAKAIATKAGAPVRGAAKCMTVLGCNVPLGFYEAVIERDPQGNKRLYGWRYLGFMPFEKCPIDGVGVECRSCETGDLYGLVYDLGQKALIFKCLSKAETDPVCHEVLCPPKKCEKPPTAENVPAPTQQQQKAP